MSTQKGSTKSRGSKKCKNFENITGSEEMVFNISLILEKIENLEGNMIHKELVEKWQEEIKALLCAELQEEIILTLLCYWLSVL
ncbi:hypothetical protein RIF29_15816 [Crotalaria pallida]|uniref:Uncharacterized protein n=1 Tax=Crotalaria pallida TaxID=3830 RepID=A0AAN9IDW9_CROPI